MVKNSKFQACLKHEKNAYKLFRKICLNVKFASENSAKIEIMPLSAKKNFEFFRIFPMNRFFKN